jgi:hypothetical protein
MTKKKILIILLKILFFIKGNELINIFIIQNVINNKSLKIIKLIKIKFLIKNYNEFINIII